jgi:hypothetical protein
MKELSTVYLALTSPSNKTDKADRLLQPDRQAGSEFLSSVSTSI